MTALSDTDLDRAIRQAEADAIDLRNRATVLGNCRAFVEQQARLGVLADADIQGNTVVLTVNFSPKAEIAADLRAGTFKGKKPEQTSEDAAPVGSYRVEEPDQPVPLNDRDFKIGPFTDAELALIRRMHGNDAGSGEIALALGRDPRGFYHKVRRVVADDAQPLTMPPDDTPVFPPQKVDPPASRPAQVPDGAAPAFTDDPVEASMRRLHQRLDRLWYDETWTAQLDYQLVKLLGEGAKLKTIATDLGLDPDKLKQRFAQLVPNPTIEEQGAVLKALKARLPVEAA